MAARFGLLAIRDEDIQRFRAAFPLLEAVEPGRGNGWVWASLSLWAHGGLFGARADDALAGLDRPGLQIWTEDDAIWYLSFHLAGHAPLRYVQTLSFLDFLRRPKRLKKGTTLKKLVDEYEGDLPSAFRSDAKLPGGPLPGSLAMLLRRRAEALCDALAEATVPFDRQTVVDALCGTSITDEERGWGLGNLPRFLEAIGIHAFEGWQEELEEERQQKRLSAQGPAPPPPDPVAPILEALGGIRPAPIDGGPVAARPSSLCLLPCACSGNVSVGFIVRPSAPGRIAWPQALGSVVVSMDGEIRVLLVPPAWAWNPRLLEGLEKAFARLPEGSSLELVSADLRDDRPTTPGASHFYSGTITEGRWRLTHAHPAVDTRRLETALAILDWAWESEPFLAADASEAVAIADKLTRSGLLGSDEGARPKVSGSRVSVRKAERAHLARTVLRHRLVDGPWELADAQQADEADAAEWKEASAKWDEALASFGKKLAAGFAAPGSEDGDVILVGKATTFRRADILKVTPRAPGALFGALYPGRDIGRARQMPESVAAVDRGMASGGFRPLGDLVCEKIPDIVIRGYGRDEADAYGVLMAGTLGQFAYELHTTFAGGGSLTTSTNPGRDDTKRRSFHTALPDAAVETILEQHAARLRTQGYKAVTHPPELVGLARELDDYLVRSAR